MGSDGSNKNDRSVSSGSVQIFSEHTGTFPERRNRWIRSQREGMNGGSRNGPGDFYQTGQTEDVLIKLFFIGICTLMTFGISVVSLVCTSDSSQCTGAGLSLHFWGNLFTILFIFSLFIRLMISRVNPYYAAIISALFTLVFGFIILFSGKHPAAASLFEDIFAFFLCLVHICFSRFFAADTVAHDSQTSGINSDNYVDTGDQQAAGSENTENPGMPIWNFYSVDTLGAEMRTDLEYFAPFFELLGYFFRKSGMSEEMCRVFSDDFFERANFLRAQTEQAELIAAKGRNCSDSDIQNNAVFSGDFITGHLQSSIMFYILATVLFFDETVSSSEGSLLSQLKNSMRISDEEFTAILNYVGNENSMSYDVSSGQWVSSDFGEDCFRSDGDRTENTDRSERRCAVDIDPGELRHAFQILRISPEETDENVRRAYLRMISRYHPDRVHAMDLEPEESEMMLEQYHQITAEINEAWTLIKTSRSIN